MSVTLTKRTFRDGDRVRVTRHMPDGRIQFIKAGRVDDIVGQSFRFTEDPDSSAPGRRVYLRFDGVGMAGWTQTIERI